MQFLSRSLCIILTILKLGVFPTRYNKDNYVRNTGRLFLHFVPLTTFPVCFGKGPAQASWLAELQLKLPFAVRARIAQPQSWPLQLESLSKIDGAGGLQSTFSEPKVGDDPVVYGKHHSHSPGSVFWRPNILTIGSCIGPAVYLGAVARCSGRRDINISPLPWMDHSLFGLDFSVDDPTVGMFGLFNQSTPVDWWTQ